MVGSAGHSRAPGFQGSPAKRTGYLTGSQEKPPGHGDVPVQFPKDEKGSARFQKGGETVS